MTIIRRVLVVSLFVAASAFGQADQEVVSVVDSPDPVLPGGTLTYTITHRNNGPNPAVNGGINVNLPGNVTYQNTVAPAGFTCSVFGANVSCTNPSFAPGTVVFTMTVVVDASLISFPDGSLVANFFPSGVTPDPNSGNNMKSATTTYNTPQINMSIAVADSPDPVGPDGNITYTVDVGNLGPDAAQNASMSLFNSGSLRFQSATVPSGWNCTLPAVNSTPTFTCTHAASFASGATSQFLIVVKAAKVVLGVNDGTVATAFSASGTGNETNHANNVETENTAYVTFDAEMAIIASDSPDPVFPDGNITYTVTVTNNGPDPTTNAGMTVVLNNTLLFQSITVPAGWTCPPLAVGHGASFTCSAAALAVASPSVFTVVLKAAQSQIGINDTTLTEVFTTGSEWPDANNANNMVSVQTAYVTPDSDMSVTASDSPDPVAPDGNITYTVNVTNGGPDAATNAVLNVPLNNTLLFQSITVPSGWTCPSLSVGHGASFSCTRATFPMSTSVFTIVLKAAQSQFGFNDTTIQQVFAVGNNNSDPNNANNLVTVSTAYVAPDADMSVTASDSPDPVAPDGNITYSINVTNGGPNATTNATFTVTLNNTLRFQSITVPAGWTCPALVVGQGTSFTCTAATFAASATSPFTVVLNAGQAQFGLANQTINQTFSVGSPIADPNNTNNLVTVSTSYASPQADLASTNADTPDPVSSGANITYAQTLTNNGPATATSVVFNQTLPAEVGFVSLVKPASFTCSTPAVGASGLINCTAPSLANATTVNFTLVVKVLALSGTVTITTFPSSAANDPNNLNTTATAATTILAPTSADLSVTKSTVTANAGPGASITYTINVTNNGPHNATSVVMTDALPASLLFQSITEPAGFTCVKPAVGTTGTITCNAATLLNGATATFTLVTTVAPNATGTITNTAGMGGAQTDANSGNSSGSSSGVIVITPTADLLISKTTPASSAVIGANLTYTIALTNNGPDAAPNPVMTDVLPSSLFFQSITEPAGFTCVKPAVGTSGTITCNAATLANGATATFTLVVQVAPGASGTITNTASGASGATDPNSGNSSSPSPGIPATSSADLQISKTTNATQAPMSGTISYTLTVINNGPSPATNVVVTDVLPTGLQFVSATPSQGTCGGTTTVTCNLGTLANGASATVALNVLVTAISGTVANTASVSAPGSDPAGGNNSSGTPALPVVPSAGIPTMSEWALIALAMMLGLMGAMRAGR